MDVRFNQGVVIHLKDVILTGDLCIPRKAKAIVVFAHGSGSSRFSRRNRMVAKYLNEKDFGTLLFDLLTEAEDEHYHNRFDIELLTKRLAGATEWLESFPAAKNCRIGYFGASTGAAAALKAAAELHSIDALVSRGGRPDMANDELPKVHTPSLFIVGGLDYDVLQLNMNAFKKLKCDKKLEVVPGATHLFEEHGTLEKVCELAEEWYHKYLMPVALVK